MGGALHASAHVGDFGRVGALIATLRDGLGAGEGPLPLAQGMTAAVPILCMAGEYDLAREFIRRLSPAGSAAGVAIARCHFAYFAEGDFWSLRAHAAAALEQGERDGEPRVIHLARAYEGIALVKLGDEAQGEALLRAAWEAATARGLHLVAHFTEVFLAGALLARRAIDEAEAFLATCSEGAGAGAITGALRSIMTARLARLRGRLDEAAAEAREAAQVCARLSPGYTAEAFTVLARIEQDRGAASASVRAARRALERLDAIGSWCNDTTLRVACVEVLHAAGEEALARRVLASTAAEVEARAARIDDPAHRARFLERVPANAQALALARRRLAGEGEAR
jgi:ATP/maltotriose-dependent transcriptional regulator MalT